MIRRLILFAKRPRLGAVKTRLVPPFASSEALEIYEAFVADQIRFLESFRSTGCRVELCVDDPWNPEGLASDVAITTQGDGDLGRRMLRAMERSASAGVGATIIIGADAPSLPRGHVLDGFDALEDGADAVVSPADDGGYVLVGVRLPREELFADVPWGGPDVMAITRERAAGAGIRMAEIAAWYDVDDAPALRRLYDDLRAGAAKTDRAPATLECLRGLAGGRRLLDRAGTDMV